MNYQTLEKEILCTGTKVIINLDGRKGEFLQITINYDESIQYLIEYSREGIYETRWFYTRQITPVEVLSFYKLQKNMYDEQ
jgi:hypothetical protein